MLSTARPIFEHVPASFADPVGLADQQADGVVSLIVVRYPAVDSASTPSLPRPSGIPQGQSILGTVYDTYVAASGQLLTVARTTTDYRFPVTPATAVSRYIDHRDAGFPAFLSLFELSQDDCARFLESVFYAECLKLHVNGTTSAPLVAAQVCRSGCSTGLIEINDFSDARSPHLQLVDLQALAGPTHQPGTEPPTIEPDGLVARLAERLNGVAGRVLLFDRQKNRAALSDRSGRAFDLDGLLVQAHRLAEARRGTSTDLPPDRDAEPDLRAAAVEDYLRERADRPRLVESSHPHATGLSALVAELQGGRASSAPPAGPGAPWLDRATPDAAQAPLATRRPERDPHVAGEGASIRSSASSTSVDLGPDAPTSLLPADEAASLPETTTEPRTAPLPIPDSQSASPTRHPLASDLDRLRSEVFALFENAVGRDRAVAHEAHILTEHDIESPISPTDTVAYLRALLCDEPPKRWHLFKRTRARVFEEVSGKLLALHAANAHHEDPVLRDILHDATKLWTRLHT